MKSRIIGSVILVIILAALFLSTEKDFDLVQPAQQAVPQTQNDSAMKSLSIN